MTHNIWFLYSNDTLCPFLTIIDDLKVLFVEVFLVPCLVIVKVDA